MELKSGKLVAERSKFLRTASKFENRIYSYSLSIFLFFLEKSSFSCGEDSNVNVGFYFGRFFLFVLDFYFSSFFSLGILIVLMIAFLLSQEVFPNYSFEMRQFIKQDKKLHVILLIAGNYTKV